MILLLLLLAGCSTADTNSDCSLLRTTATPPAGKYPKKNTPDIVLSSSCKSTPECPIIVYMTVDGTQPRKGFPNTFALEAPVKGIPIAYDGMPLRYFSEDCNGNREVPRLDRYQLDGPPETSVSPPAGLYAHPVTVTLTASEEATVYYTTDGSEPDPANPNAFSGASPFGGIKVARTTTIRFASQDSAGNLEKTKSASFQIDMIPPEVDVSPPSGTYDSPLDVEINISNDTGKIYYTLGGGTPDPKDVSGRTKFAAGSLRTTLTKSTIIHYLVEDKVGNREADLPAEGYKALSYILDCLPTVSADPAPGAYPGKTLVIRFTGQPSGGTVFYQQDNGSTQTYTAPIVLQDVPGANFEVWNDAVVGGSCGAGIQSGDHLTLAYTLGADIPSEVYSEEFTSTALLDANATTAVVDTVVGEVRLPTKPPELVRKTENNVIHTVPSALLPRAAYSFVQLGTIVMVEGGGLIGQGTGASVDNNVTGLKIYSQTDMNPTGANPEITYQATYTPTDLFTGGPYFDVAIVRALDGANLAAVARGGQVQFVSIDTPSSPKLVSANLSLTVSPVPPVLLARDDKAERLYVANAGGADFTLTSYDIDSTTATSQNAQLTFSNDQPVDMAVNDDQLAGADRNTVLVLSGNCNVYRVDAPANGSLTKNATLDTLNVCVNGTDLPRRLAAFADGGKQYIFATVVPGGGGGQVAMVKLTGNTQDDTWTNVLPEFLSAQIGGIQVIPVNAGYTDFVLALFDGPLLKLYDLKNIGNLAAGETLKALATYDLGTRSAYDAVHVGSGFLVSTLSLVPQGGGLAAFSIPATIRDTVASTVVQSVNVNPRIGTNLTSVQFLEAVNSSNVGVIDYEVKIGSAGFVSLNPGSSLAISSATDSLIWKATLKKAGLDEPVLDRVKFKMTYPEGP